MNDILNIFCSLNIAHNNMNWHDGCSNASEVILKIIGKRMTSIYKEQIDRLVQERRNCNALAMELRLSCINPLIWYTHKHSTANQNV